MEALLFPKQEVVARPVFSQDSQQQAIQILEQLRLLFVSASPADLVAGGGLILISTVEGLQFFARAIGREPDAGSAILGAMWLIAGWAVGLSILSGSLDLPGLEFAREQEDPKLAVLAALGWLVGAGMVAVTAEVGVRKTLLS